MASRARISDSPEFLCTSAVADLLSRSSALRWCQHLEGVHLPEPPACSAEYTLGVTRAVQHSALAPMLENTKALFLCGCEAVLGDIREMSVGKALPVLLRPSSKQQFGLPAFVPGRWAIPIFFWVCAQKSPHLSASLEPTSMSSAGWLQRHMPVAQD